MPTGWLRHDLAQVRVEFIVVAREDREAVLARAGVDSALVDDEVYGVVE